jgi:pSer/pThr/pTyr-binding forkhead associated (FHA) protein
MYKYNCRKCPVRNRCIDESANAPTVKEIVRHAFAARTDTLETWGLLQPECLLIKAEEERSRTAPRESMLSRRLRQAREAREEAARALSPSPDQQPDYLKPVPPAFPQVKPSFQEVRANHIGVRDVELESPGPPRLTLQQSQPASDRLMPRWLIAVESGRHIALPPDRPVVLGRFDPNFGIPPDIDLSFEDQRQHTVSRQHARITPLEGYHTIEELGSQHGSSINREPIRPGPAHPLKLGGRVHLGNVQLLYEVMPAHLLDLPRGAGVRHILLVTPTGRRVSIAPPGDILIGRSDRYVNFTPDIDLSREEEYAVRVSRRHAIITWRNHIPHVEDLGSGFGTRLNGETLLLGRAVPLKPGDHIWLGGCVLAYDVEL